MATGADIRRSGPSLLCHRRPLFHTGTSGNRVPGSEGVRVTRSCHNHTASWGPDPSRPSTRCPERGPEVTDARVTPSSCQESFEICLPAGGLRLSDSWACTFASAPSALPSGALSPLCQYATFTWTRHVMLVPASRLAQVEVAIRSSQGRPALAPAPGCADGKDTIKDSSAVNRPLPRDRL